MELTVKHVITLSPETTEMLKNLFTGFTQTSAEPKAAKTKTTKAEAPVVSIPTPVTQEMIKEQVAAASIANKPEEGPVVMKMEDVRARAQKLAMEGHRDAVKAAITAMGAENVPKMDPAKFPEFMASLDKIGA